MWEDVISVSVVKRFPCSIMHFDCESSERNIISKIEELVLFLEYFLFIEVI